MEKLEKLPIIFIYIYTHTPFFTRKREEKSTTVSNNQMSKGMNPFFGSVPPKTPEKVTLPLILNSRPLYKLTNTHHPSEFEKKEF
jgi:hypothetical protein